MNCDGQVNAFDAPLLALALTDPQRYQAVYSTCSLDNANFSRDATVDGTDIQGFVQRLLSP